MVAFNFQERFADDIIAGRKLSTIRSTMRCKIGDKLQLYTGQRTKRCKKLLLPHDPECIGLAKIIIGGTKQWEIIGHIGKYRPSPYPLHVQEGFQNLNDFIDFFNKQHGLPYSGYLHAWELR